MISPSESTLSLSSRESTVSPLPDSIAGEGNDLGSRVSLENGGKAGVTAASSRLVCPICNEEMVGLNCLIVLEKC